MDLEGTMNTRADEALLSEILVPEKLRQKSRGCFADGVPETYLRTKHCLRGSKREKWEERKEKERENQASVFEIPYPLAKVVEQNSHRISCLGSCHIEFSCLGTILKWPSTSMWNLVAADYHERCLSLPHYTGVRLLTSVFLSSLKVAAPCLLTAWERLVNTAKHKAWIIYKLEIYPGSNPPSLSNDRHRL